VMYNASDRGATTVSVNPPDVEFLNDPTGEPNRVMVTVRRTAARGNPISTIIAGMFGVTTADITATATAEASPADLMTCVKPFTIPDRWLEDGTTPSADPDTFEMYDNHGVPLPVQDVYVPATDKVNYTGYRPLRDKGMRLMIRAGTGHEISPSFYFSLTLGPGGGPRGSDEYRWNIANCNSTLMQYDDMMIQEPGNQMGPTVQGAQDLWDLDPGATWNTTCQCVVGSAFPAGKSPRVFPIPLYDPEFYSEGVRQGRYADLKVANWIGFFLEEIQSNTLYGRITPVGGLRRGTPPPGAFPVAIRLIQ
jgi:hypothetical protein